MERHARQLKLAGQKSQPPPPPPERVGRAVVVKSSSSADEPVVPLGSLALPVECRPVDYTTPHTHRRGNLAELSRTHIAVGVGYRTTGIPQDHEALWPFPDGGPAGANQKAAQRGGKSGDQVPRHDAHHARADERDIA
jgi:hypothetical protein